MLTESSEGNMKTNIIGKPIDRVDARLKVTGAAKYAAEFPQNNLAYAFPVRSTIGKGTIAAIDASAAEKSTGVIAVLTHKNATRLKPANIMEVGLYGTLPGESLLPLQADKIFYVGQYIGLIVAETYEQARAAAELVKVNGAARAMRPPPAPCGCGSCPPRHRCVYTSLPDTLGRWQPATQ